MRDRGKCSQNGRAKQANKLRQHIKPLKPDAGRGEGSRAGIYQGKELELKEDRPITVRPIKLPFLAHVSVLLFRFCKRINSVYDLFTFQLDMSTKVKSEHGIGLSVKFLVVIWWNSNGDDDASKEKQLKEEEPERGS